MHRWFFALESLDRNVGLILTAYEETYIERSYNSPDQQSVAPPTLRSLRATKSVDRRILCGLETSFDIFLCSKIVKGSVRTESCSY